MKLKQRLSEYRKASGISQEEAAEKLNVSRQTIGRWEQGRTIPSMVILVVTVVVSVLFFQGQAEDSVSESELQGEVIDILPGKLDILPVE